MVAIAQFFIVWGGGLFLVGFAAVAVVIWLISKIVRFLGRVIAGMDAASTSGYRSRATSRVCRNDQCSHVNEPGARFCGRCGQPLPPDTDTYG